MFDFLLFIGYSVAMMATLMILGEMVWEGWKEFRKDD